jgi:signal peptidase II
MALTIIIDQAAKWIAEGALDPAERIAVLPILDLHYTQNTGIAFSFLNSTNGTVLLGVVVAITVIVLIFWVRAREGGRLATLGFGLIVGGAVGNIIDRLMNGYVVDFLVLHFGDRDMFVFNLADSALTLGPIVLIVAYMFAPRRPA